MRFFVTTTARINVARGVTWGSSRATVSDLCKVSQVRRSGNRASPGTFCTLPRKIWVRKPLPSKDFNLGRVLFWCANHGRLFQHNRPIVLKKSVFWNGQESDRWKRLFRTPPREIRVRQPLSEVKISISDACFSVAETMADFFNRIGRLQSFSAWLTYSRWVAPADTHQLQTAGQLECKWLVKSDANDWSVVMQLGRQVRCN